MIRFHLNDRVYIQGLEIPFSPLTVENDVSFINAWDSEAGFLCKHPLGHIGSPCIYCAYEDSYASV